jgi:hypothetical protein
MGGKRWQGWAWTAAVGLPLLVATVVAWQGLRGAKGGDVDPGGVVIGLVGLAVTLAASVVAIWLAVRGQRVTDTDVDVWARRLATSVRNAETAQRTQLLGGQGRTINVKFVLTPAPAHNAAGARPEGTLTAVAGYFRDLRPQRLVITGQGGAGKTVLAIELILALLAGWSPDEPVPIRVPAAGWDPQRVPVRRWLTTHLVRTFDMRQETAQALVEAYRVLPVIDGLDEMDASQTPGYPSLVGRAVRALNAYQDGQDKARMVLTCRTGQYDALTTGEVWAHDAARVDLAPVTADQASVFIEAVAGAHQIPRWQPVLDALTRPGHPLAATLDTPWRL